MLQYTRFAYTDQRTRRRISNAATPKPGRFDEEWKELGLAPMRMRGRTELPEASLILTSVKKEMKVGGKLQTRTFLAPFGCKEIKAVHGEEEDESAGTLLIPRFQEEADNDEQGPSSSNKDKSEGNDGQDGSRQTEEPMQQDQAGGEDDRASTGGTSSLDFNIFSDLENNADTLETTEPADEGISTLEPPSAFMEMKRNLPESSSPGNSRNNDQRILMESPRRRRIETSARVPFLGTLPEEEWEVHHRDHESRTGCKLDRVAFMEEVWTVIQSYGTQSILKTGLNQPLMREVLDKLDECEGRLSELLIDSATDESEANSPTKMTPQDDEGEVVYLSRTRRGTMRSKMVIDKINAMKMKLGSRVMPRRVGKTKVDSEISMKAGNSAKRKRVEEVMDLGQGDYQLPGTDKMLTDIAMVPLILTAGIKSTGYKSKSSDRTLTGATSDYKQAVLLRFWTSRIVTIKSVNNPQAKLGLVLEEEVTAPSVPKSDKRVEFVLGFSDELLRTSLMAVWELMRPSWCPSPNADSILRATQDVQRELNADCNLRDLNIIYNVMITASKSNGEDKVELPGWGPEDWVKPGSCLAEVCGLEGHVCGGLDCVKTLEKQHKQLTVLFGNVVMKARTETELTADCHGGTDVNQVTALGFCSKFGSLESLLNLEQKHEMVTAISVEVFPGVLQTEQKYIGKWREAIETEMNIRHSETYCRPSGARYLVGSTLAPMCKSRYPVHFVAVDVKSTRTIVDQAFSVPKCVRLARMSEKSYELLCKMFSAVPERTKEELESILGKKFMGYVSGNFSDFEKQKQEDQLSQITMQ